MFSFLYKITRQLSTILNSEQIKYFIDVGKRYYNLLKSYSLGTVFIPDVGDLILTLSSVWEVGGGRRSTSPHTPEILPNLCMVIGNSGYTMCSLNLYWLCPLSKSNGILLAKGVHRHQVSYLLFACTYFLVSWSSMITWSDSFTWCICLYANTSF